MKKIILLAFAIPLSMCAMQSSEVAAPSICHQAIDRSDFTIEQKERLAIPEVRNSFAQAEKYAQDNSIDLSREFYQLKQYIQYLETIEIPQAPSHYDSVQKSKWDASRSLKPLSDQEQSALCEWKKILETISSNAFLDGYPEQLQTHLIRLKAMAGTDLNSVNFILNNPKPIELTHYQPKIVFICGGIGVFILCTSVIAYKIYKAVQKKKNQKSKAKTQAHEAYKDNV